MTVTDRNALSIVWASHMATVCGFGSGLAIVGWISAGKVVASAVAYGCLLGLWLAGNAWVYRRTVQHESKGRTNGT